MSALFDFSSLLTVLLLMICTCTYLREYRPKIFDPTLPVQVSTVLLLFLLLLLLLLLLGMLSHRQLSRGRTHAHTHTQNQ